MKSYRGVALVVTAMVTLNAVAVPVLAAPLSNAYVVLGAGNNNPNEMRDTLDKQHKAKELTVTGADADKYLQMNGVSSQSLKSSVSIAPAEPGTGALVNILPYDGKDMITQVTAQQYAMAATTAGVNDVIITVTSNEQVSGTSALSGVYKAMEADGHQLEAENTKSANDLMTSMNQAQKELKPEDAGKLSGSVMQSASDVAKAKQQGDTINQTTIQNILQNNLNNNNINISVQAQAPIVSALQTFEKSPIADSKGFIKNAEAQAKTLKDSTGDMMASAKDFLNKADADQLLADASEKASGFWAMFQAWFADALETVKSWF